MDISQFNWFDYCLLTLIFLSIIIGAKRGLLREVISLITWIAAFFIAIIFAKDFSSIYIAQYIKNDGIAVILSFLLLFITTLIIGALINYIITSFVERVGIMWGNYFLGALFGFIRGVLITFFIVFFLVHTGAKEKEWFKKAQTPQMLAGSVNLVQSHFPTLMKEKKKKTKKLSKQLSDEVQKDLDQLEDKLEENMEKKLL